MSLDAILTQISTLEATIAGVVKANDNPPATMNVFPCFVNFPQSGAIDRRPSARWPTHTIVLELHVTKAILPESVSKLRPFLELTLNKFDSNLSLNGACGNARIISYQMGVLTYNGEQHIGITFTMEATEITPYSFAA